jgi:hypothetical protein
MAACLLRIILRMRQLRSDRLEEHNEPFCLERENISCATYRGITAQSPGFADSGGRSEPPLKHILALAGELIQERRMTGRVDRRIR